MSESRITALHCMEDYKFIKALHSHTQNLDVTSYFTIKVKKQAGSMNRGNSKTAFSGQVTSFICLAHYIMCTLYVLYCTANSFHMKIKAVGRNLFSLDRNEN